MRGVVQVGRGGPRAHGLVLQVELVQFFMWEWFSWGGGGGWLFRFSEGDGLIRAGGCQEIVEKNKIILLC